MLLLSIDHIERKDVPVYYRNDYSGVSEWESREKKHVLVGLSFSIEQMPTGEKKVTLGLEEKVDYPLLPLCRSLKERILSMESEGLLPQ